MTELEQVHVSVDRVRKEPFVSLTLTSVEASVTVKLNLQTTLGLSKALQQGVSDALNEVSENETP